MRNWFIFGWKSDKNELKIGPKLDEIWLEMDSNLVENRTEMGLLFISIYIQ